MYCDDCFNKSYLSSSSLSIVETESIRRLDIPDFAMECCEVYRVLNVICESANE